MQRKRLLCFFIQKRGQTTGESSLTSRVSRSTVGQVNTVMSMTAHFKVKRDISFVSVMVLFVSNSIYTVEAERWISDAIQCIVYTVHFVHFKCTNQQKEKEKDLNSKAPCNFPLKVSWPYLLREMSVWFNVSLTVIGFWCLPLITTEKNEEDQFRLWMHTKLHQKLRWSWRLQTFIGAFHVRLSQSLIGNVLFICGGRGLESWFSNVSVYSPVRV